MRPALAALVLMTGAACAPVSAADNEIVVGIEHSRFSPSEITVDAGETVTFVITNGDPIDHELIVGDETVQDEHEKGTEARHGAKPGEVTVEAGETATTTYTFDEPGRLIFGCHLPGHYAYGMRGTIVVVR